jgi:ATP-dependent exoDNAse (exonuclease V) beta subunit
VSDLPDAQQRLRALTELNSTLLIEAAAGTGKTSLIAGRVSMALISGTPPSEIVAITFTQAAADELSIRIHEYIAELCAERIPLCLTVALPQRLRPTQRERLMRAAEGMDALTVTTIHGFCQKLILSYAVEAGIDPGAKMMDGPQAEAEFEAVFNRWLSRRLATSRGFEDPIESLSEEDPRGIVKALRALASERRRHRTAGAVRADLTSRLDVMFTESVAAFTRWINRAPSLSPLSHLAQDLGILADIYRNCLDPTPTFRQLWELAHPPELKSSMRFDSSDLREPRWASFWKDPKDSEAGAQLRLEAQSLFSGVCTAYRALRGQIATALCHLLFGELDEVMADYDDFKRAAAVLDFDDLLYRARSLVRDHEPVRLALGERYRCLLVDEFQDTDPLQAEILFRIAAEEPNTQWQLCRLRAGSLFMVGDPKQAIYGFRGADIDSYMRAKEAIKKRWPENILHISANFRSVPAILTYVNERFESALSEVAGQPGYVELTAVREAPRHNFPCVAQTALPLDEDAKADDVRKAEAVHVAALCEQLIGTLPVRDSAGSWVPLRPEGIALLTPNYSQLWRYERALEERNLPFASRAGKSLLRRQEIQDMLALTRALADSNDTLAFGALMRGPLVGLTDEELLDITLALPERDEPSQRFCLMTDPALVTHSLAHETLLILRELQRQAHTTTPALLLAQAVERLSLRPLLAAREGSRRCRATANVERFIALAKPYDIAGLKRFVRDLSNEWARHRDGRVEGRVDSEGAIELTTMHSSKGLEWPVVILINTVGKVDRRDEFVHRTDDDTLHWVLQDVAPPELSIVLEQEGRHTARERQRVWYVASTRAREMLIIPSVPPPKYHKAWAQVIDNAYQGLPDLTIPPGKKLRLPRAAELPNLQTAEQFEIEHRKVVGAAQTVRWVRPSEKDPDRMHEVMTSVIEAALDTPEISAPVGAGRLRGLLLHKLIEEVLTGELIDEPKGLSARAQELLKQLSRDRAVARDTPEVGELSVTVQRTLALPEIAAIRGKLIPEVSVYDLRLTEAGAMALSGRADGVVEEAGRVSVVVDWKSDISPSREDVERHAQQLKDYLAALHAPRGALVYMTSGVVHWVRGDS